MPEAMVHPSLGRADPAVYIVSPEVAEGLRAELASLRARKRCKVRQRLRDVHTFGDGSENDEYHGVREDETVLDARIASLEELLRRSRVADGAAFKSGAIIIGSTATVEDLETGKTERYRLVGTRKRLAPGEVSVASPIGQALLGRRAGERVTVSLPRGRARRLEVVATTVPRLAGEAVA